MGAMAAAVASSGPETPPVLWETGGQAGKQILLPQGPSASQAENPSLGSLLCYKTPTPFSAAPGACRAGVEAQGTRPLPHRLTDAWGQRPPSAGDNLSTLRPT